MTLSREIYTQDLKESKIKMEKDGFVVYKNVLNKELLEETRTEIIKYLNKFGRRSISSKILSNAAVHIPFLEKIFTDNGIIEKLNYLIEDEIVFTSHCDVTIGMQSDWHKDDGTLGGSSKGYFGELTYGKKDCKVYKVALYLQDHSKNSGGLSVIPGSHKTKDSEIKGEPINLKTKFGDIIIFDVRLTHSGQRDIIPLNWNKKNYWIKNTLDRIKKISLIGSLISTLIKILYESINGSKASIFFTYGANNSWTSKFAISNMRRQISYLQNKTTKLPEKTRQSLEKKNILIFDNFQKTNNL